MGWEWAGEFFAFLDLADAAEAFDSSLGERSSKSSSAASVKKQPHFVKFCPSPNNPSPLPLSTRSQVQRWWEEL